MENSKKIDWYTLSFMAFSTVWGFGNVLNGFVYFNGIEVIFSWILMFVLYHQSEVCLLCWLDLLGLPRNLHCQQGKRRLKGIKLDGIPERKHV